MSRLIDADALLGILNGLLLENVYEQEMIERIIKYAPTIEQQQWIPVTERLPKKYIGEWLCCTDDGNIMILPYDTPGDGSKECVFYYWEDDYTVVKPNVVAWMPLPEPWKGESDGTSPYM